MHRSNLDDERVVSIADRDVDAAQANHLVKLVTTFVDVSEIGSECPCLIFFAVEGGGQRAP